VLRLTIELSNAKQAGRGACTTRAPDSAARIGTQGPHDFVHALGARGRWIARRAMIGSDAR